MISRSPGDQVKTDRRDAIRLARLAAAGELRFAFVPRVALQDAAAVGVSAGRLAMLGRVPLRPFQHVRVRLWPTRRRFDMRDLETQQRLEEIQQTIGALAQDQQRLLDEQRQLVDGQAELRTRLRRTQALTARAYERLGRWPELLHAAREQLDYELAYRDPDPLISIPIPTYHRPDVLCQRSLASVRAQTHANWEAIVVGDHCTDDTEARVRAIGDPRIRFHNLPFREVDPDDPWERWAVSGTVPRATGIGLAGGRWIAPLSDDDAWDPGHLQRLLETARASRAEVVYSQMRVHELDAEPPGISEPARMVGGWPPRLGQFAWQSSMFHGSLRFLRYDRTCALASEPNDWNLARRAWEAGVRFEFVPRDTMTYFYARRHLAMSEEYAARGLPPSAMASP